MFARRSLGWPITLAVAMIVMLVTLAVGWVIMAVRSAIENASGAGLYWVLLAVGATLFVLVVVGVVLYLTLSIKAINITQRQSNFIDSVTHELKSPIASLKLYLQTLKRRRVSEAEQREFFKLMLEDVERLDQLINHILAAAHLERGSASKPQAVELSELLRQCAAGVCLRYRVSSSIVSFDTEPCVVTASKVDLELIFRNLLDNAVKYAGSPPRVSVWLRKMGQDQVQVLISDNGKGIPRHLRRKIFGRFVRLGKELEREKPGTGLGLYIVRTIAKRLQARVLVRDSSEQQGTLFEVILPGVAPQARETLKSPGKQLSAVDQSADVPVPP